MLSHPSRGEGWPKPEAVAASGGGRRPSGGTYADDSAAGFLHDALLGVVGDGGGGGTVQAVEVAEALVPARMILAIWCAWVVST